MCDGRGDAKGRNGGRVKGKLWHGRAQGMGRVRGIGRSGRGRFLWHIQVRGHWPEPAQRHGQRRQREHDRGAKGWVLVASSGGGLLRFASQHVTLQCYPKVGSIRERCGDRIGARDNEAVGSVAPDTSAMSHALRCSIALWKEAQAVGSGDLHPNT